MKDILKALYSLDYFAQSLEISFEKKKRLPTPIGFFFTIAIVGIAIAVTISSAEDLIYRLKPKVNSNIYYKETARNLTIAPENFYFSYSFNNGETQYLLDPTYANIRIANFRLNRWIDDVTQEDKVFMERVPIHFEKCGNNLDYYMGMFNREGNFTREIND